MLRSTLSRVRRRIAAAGLVAISLALAACSDAATSPASTAPRQLGGPNSAIVGTGGGQVATFATVKIVDVHGATLNDPAEVTFKSFPSGWSIVIKDNETGDYNSTPGVITAALKPGSSYEACFKWAYHYMNDNRDPLTYPQCSKVTSSSFNVDLGKVFGRKYPTAAWVSWDIYDNLLVPGGTLQLSASGWNAIIADRDLNYGGPLDGMVMLELRVPPGTVSWCEYTPPSKYVLVSAKCGSFTSEFEKRYRINWIHQKLLY